MLENVKNEQSDIFDITEVRLNTSAVFGCTDNDKSCIFKYFIIGDINNIEF